MTSCVQGIIVSGEASESDEEEEFCINQAKSQLREFIYCDYIMLD